MIAGSIVANPAVAAVVHAMEQIAPLQLADSAWDNVGLLVEAPAAKNFSPVAAVLLTIDFDERVLQEALSRRCAMVMSYHPPIFAPLRRLTLSDWKQRAILGAISHGISIYSPHSALDAAEGGVNDWLCSLFVSDGNAIEEISPILPVPAQKRATAATGTPPAPRSVTGYGRLATLRASVSLNSAIEQIKTTLKLASVRVAVPPSLPLPCAVRKIAVGAGSGASVLRALVPGSADLFLTGELGHHDILNAVSNGMVVVLTEHSNSERGYLSSVLQPKLASMLEHEGIEVFVAESDADPLVPT